MLFPKCKQERDAYGESQRAHKKPPAHKEEAHKEPAQKNQGASSKNQEASSKNQGDSSKTKQPAQKIKEPALKEGVYKEGALYLCTHGDLEKGAGSGWGRK